MTLYPGAGGHLTRPGTIGHAVDDRQARTEVARVALEPDHGAVAPPSTVQDLLLGVGRLGQYWAL